MTMPLPLGYQSLIRERYGSLTAKLRTNLLSRTQRFASSPSRYNVKDATL
jgi:hypothetical protein